MLKHSQLGQRSETGGKYGDIEHMKHSCQKIQFIDDLHLAECCKTFPPSEFLGRGKTAPSHSTALHTDLSN